MLTFFTTAKPFRGHIGLIQRNALESWKRLRPDVEIVLFGDDEGATEVCRDLGLLHEPHVDLSPSGAIRADSMFRRAQEIARHNLLCYSNCDIVLTQDFRRALGNLLAWRSTFLMVGRRWDADIVERIDFSAPDWQERIVTRAKREGIQRFFHNIDYFAFTRGVYRGMPALVVGRAWWDHWMVWHVLTQNVAVVDASEVVCAVHQNHDYSHHPEGMHAVFHGEDAQRNFQLAGGYRCSRTIEDAPFRLTVRGIVPNRFHRLGPAKRRVRAVSKSVRGFFRNKLWHPLLNATRPIRHVLGLRQENMPPVLRSGAKRHWLD